MNLVTIPEAAKWASFYLKKEVSPTNISYLVQYGKIKKYSDNGNTLIDLGDLEKYYQSWKWKREINWKNQLGDDLNWSLSFDHLREKDTTKHVHRLHPYKGKFIPQLVEYFIDDHIDDFKHTVFFKPGDIILDPFLGSGTTIIQSLELGIHSIGIDISEFNCMIADCKACQYDHIYLNNAVKRILRSLDKFTNNNKVYEFENELLFELSRFNSAYFPGHEFRFKLNRKFIDEEKYGQEKEDEFLTIYKKLIDKYGIVLNHKHHSASFLDSWYISNVRQEIDFLFNEIRKEDDINTRKLLALILSRTIRSCRATTHSDLATLKEPQLSTYYCYKHKKICKPIFSIKKMFNRYAKDSLNRISIFYKIRKPVYYSIISGDSRTVDIFDKVKNRNQRFFALLSQQKIAGIFCSPPYVGQIDYHEQHAYAYELLGFKRYDELEIGPLYKGQGVEARKSYVQGIIDVLINCKRFLKSDCNIFIVANDKYQLYPEIAERSGLKIVNQYKRPVLNRTERDRNPYSEIIFHLKGK